MAARTSPLAAGSRAWSLLSRAVGLLLSLVLCIAFGLGVVGTFMISHFGRSFLGFVALVSLVLLVGASLGYWLTRLGRRGMPTIAVMGLLYAAPTALAMTDMGGPPILVPILPLLVASVLVGGRRRIRFLKHEFADDPNHL